MKYRTTATTAIAIGLACGATAALADHPSIAFGSEGVGALNTISATPLAAGSWGAGLRVEAIDNDEFTTEQLEQFAADGLEGVHSTKSMTSTSLSLAYGATDNFTISARLPYIERKNIREGELEGGTPEAHTHGDSAGLGDLSTREQEVLALTAEGFSSREIGQKLFISPKTVDTYRSRIMDKLGLSHRSELVRFALRVGLLKEI